MAVGRDGCIRLGGPVVFAGYRLRPDLSAASLVEGWHQTHDVGRFDGEGRLVVLGRADDVVVSGGEKVSLAVVEAAIETHPAVREAAAVAVADAEWGQHIVAVLVSTSGRGVLLGLGAGLILSIVGGTLLRGYLYGLSPLDPLAYSGVLALLGLTAAAATFVPARRACRVDPAVTLREE